MIKRSVVIKAKRIKPITGLNFDYKTIIFFTLFFCGIITGIIIVSKCDNEFNNFLCRLLINNFSAKQENGPFTNFCGTFIWLFLLVFCTYLCGLSAVGFPFIWIIPTVFGIICGLIVSSFYHSFGLKGLGFCVIANIPCYAITAATLIKCCCESTIISNEIFGYVFGNSKGEGNKKMLLKDYSINYLLLCLPILIAALISMLCFKLFSGFFSFV